MLYVLILKLLSYYITFKKCLNSIILILKDELSFFPNQINKFEDELRKEYGKDFYILTLSNATIGLTHAYNIFKSSKNCDRALINPIVIPSNYVGALHCGYELVTVNLDEKTLNFNLDELEKQKNNFDLICVTHYFGYTCDMKLLKNWCLANKKHLIEDCSHCHGGEFSGRKLGTFGEVSVFSLQGSKFISGGEGAYIITKNKKYFLELCKSIYQDKWYDRAKRQCPDVDNVSVSFGLKSRMHPISASLSLPDVKTMNFRNKLMNMIYDQLYNSNPSLFLPKNTNLKMGGFANGICIRVKNKNLYRKIKTNFILKSIIYTRDYSKYFNVLKIKIKSDTKKQIRVINDEYLYFSKPIFTSLLRFFVLRRILNDNRN